ncbi:P-loop containing nucleoside triphosphate hydrolase protein [Terfezia claveryi]|nr:P-loop containing nucleoside triphosphate hydrolase protein [Terfezia claveryi]
MAGKLINSRGERFDEEGYGEYSNPLALFRGGGPTFSVRVPIVVNTEEYEIFPSEFRVRYVLKEHQRNEELYYTCRFDDGHVAEVPFDTLISMENGPEAFSVFTPQEHDSSRANSDELTPRRAAQEQDSLFFNPEGDKSSSDDLVITDIRQNGSEKRENKRKTAQRRQDTSSEGDSLATPKRSRRPNACSHSVSSSTRVVSSGTRSGQHITPASAESKEVTPAPRGGRALRSSGVKKYRMLSYKVKQPDEETDVETISSSDIVYSDLLPKRPQRSTRKGKTKTTRMQDSSADEENGGHARRSGRTERKKNIYREPNLDDDDDFTITVMGKPKPKPKSVSAKERFPIYDDHDEFVRFHNQTCDTCHRAGDSLEVGPLIYCQGCSYSYHRVCLGNRTSREHLVTRIDEDICVMQCRRCIGRPRMKDCTAPCLDRCQKCHGTGVSCIPFKPVNKGKAAASEKASPEVDISPDLINNPDNLLFRCVICRRGYHFEHLPPRAPEADKGSSNLPQRRFIEYSRDWKCLDCVSIPNKIQAFVAWRPADQSAFGPDLYIDDFNDDEREYLVKFEELSYFRAKWMPGPWVWGLMNGLMRNKFCAAKPPPKLTFEDVVDPEFLNVEIVLDVKFTSIVPLGNDAVVDLARVKEVSKALVKYRGLGYEDVVWEEPPLRDSGERWKCFEEAYEDYIYGLYVHPPKGVQGRIERVRSQSFEFLEQNSQPKYIVGGTLMDYQKDGMNWLYYKWWKGENSILADEMGLGKTIQIISFLSLLHQEHKVWPFLIVVPHSTVPNWKREIKQWNPSLRVVAYFGGKEARGLSRQYEMFHPRGKDLKCHIVITSYTTPIDDANILKQIPWEGLIVDEGQRLKNDDSLLYKALSGFKIKHKVLLTGTPLQNNPRELFNLLQFIDPKDMKASRLEEEYGELTKENVPELHALIRPYFLRRTKAQVLTMLPPMAEIIVPVSMTKLTKKLYKSILAKDAGLIKAILGRGGSIKSTERTKLNNILMQLRKCLCHPFIYSDEIEEKVDDDEISHKNLVEASAKLELLNLMLPELKERGHRVLIFSQFLGMLDVVEDFLDGLGMKHTRLDGSVSSMERQKRIDAYNAPNSELFAFLLSTRAGGVGINLATADTVIILDPDFNPHQDLQALSRAHRIGQKKKVLVFHLMTRDTAEERIMQLGKKKLSLDHLIIDRMGADEDEGVDVESILKFGAAALFSDEVEQKVVNYDIASIEALLDRSQIEQTTSSDKEESAESTFSFARVWENEKGSLVEDGFGTGEYEISESTWDKILQEREAEAQREREEKARREQLGRGRRNRAPIQTYAGDVDIEDSGSDTDFQAPPEKQSDNSDSDDEADNEIVKEALDLAGKWKTKVRDPFTRRPSVQPLQQEYDADPNFIPPSDAKPQWRVSPHFVPDPPPPLRSVMQLSQQPTAHQHQQQQNLPIQPLPPRAHQVAHLLTQPPPPPANASAPAKGCLACKSPHGPGQCPYKAAGVEHCPLCNIAHYGKGPICPHINSETQVVAMMTTLRESAEDPVLVSEAVKYLRGRLGELRRRKRQVKKEEEQQEAAAALAKEREMAVAAAMRTRGPDVMVID